MPLIHLLTYSRHFRFWCWTIETIFQPLMCLTIHVRRHPGTISKHWSSRNPQCGSLILDLVLPNIILQTYFFYLCQHNYDLLFCRSKMMPRDMKYAIMVQVFQTRISISHSFRPYLHVKLTWIFAPKMGKLWKNGIFFEF